MEEPVEKQVTLKTPAAKRVAEAQSIIEKELSNLSDNVSPNYRSLLAFANAFLITAKHVDFSAEEPRHLSRDQEEVPNAKQSSVNSE